MKLENRIKCVLMDFEINEVSLKVATKRILSLLGGVYCEGIDEDIIRDIKTVGTKKELQNSTFHLANAFALLGEGEIAQELHILHNKIN